MTNKPETEERTLETFFAAERETFLAPSDAFLARVAADAVKTQASIAQQAEQKIPRGAFRWPNWGAVAGLTACLVLGVGLGSGFSGQIGAYGDFYLSGGVVASEGLFPTGLDTFLTEEEG
ncbi:MAG: hypothetical protein QNI90_00980 [Dinoroseobacter sp.]|nr:hypothetical protein [Dinoroseobacter sp.]